MRLCWRPLIPVLLCFHLLLSPTSQSSCLVSSSAAGQIVEYVFVCYSSGRTRRVARGHFCWTEADISPLFDARLMRSSPRCSSSASRGDKEPTRRMSWCLSASAHALGCTPRLARNCQVLKAVQLVDDLAVAPSLWRRPIGGASCVSSRSRSNNNSKGHDRRLPPC